MIATLKGRGIQDGIRLLKYRIDARDVAFQVGLAYGPSSKVRNRVLWSMSIEVPIHLDMTDDVIQQAKRLLLPHIPMVICGCNFTTSGSMVCSLIQSDTMPYAGN